MTDRAMTPDVLALRAKLERYREGVKEMVATSPAEFDSPVNGPFAGELAYIDFVRRKAEEILSDDAQVEAMREPDEEVSQEVLESLRIKRKVLEHKSAPDAQEAVIRNTLRALAPPTPAELGTHIHDALEAADSLLLLRDFLVGASRLQTFPDVNKAINRLSSDRDKIRDAILTLARQLP